MRRLLITGAGGFVGRPCVAHALAGGWEVHAAVHSPPIDSLATNVSVEDLLAPGAPERLVRRVRPDALLHLAWVAAPQTYWQSALNEAWRDASWRLLSAFMSQGGTRAVVAGSCAEYDWSSGSTVLDERVTPITPRSAYGRAKADLGECVQAIVDADGCRAAWARLFFVYGPREHPDRLVPSVARAMLSRSAIACTDGRQVRDYLHVDDVAQALLALLSSRVTGTVNIASGDGVEVRRIVELIAEATGGSGLARFGHLATSPDEPSHLVAAVDRLRDAVGWTPTIPLRSGLDSTVAWWRTYLQNGGT